VIKRILYRISYVLYWLPCLWKVWWWDGTYLLGILIHALAYNAKAFRKWGHLENNEEVAAQIDGVVAALARLIVDAYVSEDLHRWSEKWGEMVWKPCEDHSGYSELVGFENEKTPEDSEQCHKECSEMDDKHLRLRTADLELVFGTLKRELDGWWD